MRKKLLISLIPLILLGIGVFYYISRKNPYKDTSSSGELQVFSTTTLVENVIDNKFVINPPTPGFGLEIKGDDDFKSKVKEALRLLWLYDKEGSFKMVRRYIFEIRQSNRTTFYYDGEIPVIEISNYIYKKSSLTYLASLIAHMGWHGYYIFNVKKKANKKEVLPPGKEKIEKDFDLFGKEFKRFKTPFEVEEMAFRYQIEVLKKINAPFNEVRFIEKRDYKDFSLAHDGKYIIYH